MNSSDFTLISSGALDGGQSILSGSFFNDTHFAFGTFYSILLVDSLKNISWQQKCFNSSGI